MTSRSLGWLRARAGRGILGVLLGLMAVGQLADVSGFVDIIASYRVGGRGIAVPMAAALVVGESSAAAGLLIGDAARRRWAATIAVALAVAWTALGVQAFSRGLALDNCGCFGVYAGQSLRWWVLVEDAEFVALAVWVRRGLMGRVVASAAGTGAEDSVVHDPNRSRGMSSTRRAMR